MIILTRFDCLCTICALASLTSYIELFTRSSFLNSFLIIAACVSFRRRDTSLLCVGCGHNSSSYGSCWLGAS